MGPHDPQVRQLLLDHREIDPESGCWIWTGDVHPSGYGMLDLGGQWPWRVHRLSYITFVGEIGKGPNGKTLQILHSCNTPLCFNPEHLTPGTASENMKQMVREGRGKQPGKRLTESDVQLAYYLRDQGWDRHQIADMLTHVTGQYTAHGTVGRLLDGSRWSHLWKEWKEQHAADRTARAGLPGGQVSGGGHRNDRAQP